jgi:hypothetical protein
MDEAACIMQRKGTYPIQKTVELPDLVHKLDQEEALTHIPI